MRSVIIIVPAALETEADQLAQALGLPGGQLTQPYGEDGHLMCHFPGSETFAAALAGPLPGWVQHVDCDADPVPADPGKVCIFTSGSLDGWVHLAAVDQWPRV